jgi:hypothetical protein
MVDDKYYKGGGKKSAVDTIQGGKYLNPFGPTTRTSKISFDKRSSPAQPRKSLHMLLNPNCDENEEHVMNNSHYE